MEPNVTQNIKNIEKYTNLMSLKEPLRALRDESLKEDELDLTGNE